MFHRSRTPRPRRRCSIGQQEGCERAVPKSQDHGGGVFFFEPHDIVGDLGGKALDLAADITKRIDFVDQIGQHRTGFRFFPPFRRIVVVMFAEIPLPGHGDEPAQFPRSYDFARFVNQRVVPAMVPNQDMPVSLGHLFYNPFGLLDRRHDRFLDQDMTARLECRQRGLAMMLGRCRHDHAIDALGREHRSQVAMMRNAPFVSQGPSRRCGVDNSDKFGNRNLGNRAGVAAADDAPSNNGQPDGRHCVCSVNGTVDMI